MVYPGSRFRRRIRRTSLTLWLRAPIFPVGFAQQHRSLCGQKHRLVPACDWGHSQYVARLIERINALLHIAAEDRCLIFWIGRSATRPGEFEIDMAHPGLNDAVDQPFDPPEQGREPFFQCRFLRSLRRGPVDLRGEGGGRQ